MQAYPLGMEEPNLVISLMTEHGSMVNVMGKVSKITIFMEVTFRDHENSRVGPRIEGEWSRKKCTIKEQLV